MKIDISKILSQIHAIPQDNTLYLIEKFPSGTGLFASNGNIFYLVPNHEQCASLSIKTEFLYLETNVFVAAFNASVSSFENGYYNTVELQMSDSNEAEGNLSAFVNLCFSHASYMQGQEFMHFFDSLVALFQLPQEQHYKNLIGLMGELLFIEHIYKNYEVDLSEYWHSDGSTSRLDFVCPFANFEVKTTTGDSLSFLVKHNQLFMDAEKNILVAVVLEESNSGRTLEELICNLLEAPDFCNNMRFSINIEKERRRISPTEINNKRFLFKKMNAYRANEINPFGQIPDCVEDMHYKLDLVSFKEESFANVLH